MSDVTCDRRDYDRAFAGITQRYLTPEAAPTTYICRRVRIPDLPEFRMALTELLSRLAFCDVWDERPDGLTPDECAALGSAIMDSYDESGDFCMIGAIMPFAGADLPGNMLWCNGATYDRADYEELYSKLHASLILDADHFKTPDLRGRFPLGWNGNIIGDDTLTNGGASEVALTLEQMPPHAHLYFDPGHTHTTEEHNHTLTDPGHNHTQNAHNHTQDAHNHTQNAHLHDIAHTHTIFGRTNATGFGNTNRTAMADAGGANSTPSTQSQSTTNSGNTTATNNAATATNQAATATNNANTTGISLGAASPEAQNAATNIEILPEGGYLSEAEELVTQPHDNMPPYLAVRYVIIAK